mmetsp:Transcript_128256/g.369372  ORF Transcript_128256/g.369372 Transcript_128256/m.369372 type:complete len:166 (+) Transcript_128256:123-620(+)
MKAVTCATLLLGATTVVAGFSIRSHPQSSPSTVMRLHAEKGQSHNKLAKATSAAALLLGWTLMGPMTAMADSTSLDFSLPKYDTNMQGFGDGTEAILNTRGRADRTDPGANEKEKQEESMRKAEEARQQAKAQKKAQQKALEDEAKRRAAEKKARDAERLKNIWN